MSNLQKPYKPHRFTELLECDYRNNSGFLGNFHGFPSCAFEELLLGPTAESITVRLLRLWGDGLGKAIGILVLDQKESIIEAVLPRTPLLTLPESRLALFFLMEKGGANIKFVISRIGYAAIHERMQQYTTPCCCLLTLQIAGRQLDGCRSYWERWRRTFTKSFLIMIPKSAFDTGNDGTCQREET
ncbi:unnamed protein product [Microthlaspi erraticum]|uniref:Uncharacterized protein n=1 Tax=Microthlaspi erraticum TaxID=1685480 RepID=A0A6D2JD77_9BRAS|nr:unnamed protein product [Microthlaspi erraticum]